MRQHRLVGSGRLRHLDLHLETVLEQVVVRQVLGRSPATARTAGAPASPRLRRGASRGNDLVDLDHGVALLAQVDARPRPAAPPGRPAARPRPRPAAASASPGATPRSAPAGWRAAGLAFQAASFSTPSFFASSAARAATTRSRTRSFTSANGSVRAGVYCDDASGDQACWARSRRLRCCASSRALSGENSAFRNFGLASAPVAPGAACARTLLAVLISSFSLSATGLRLSACS